MSQSSNQKTTKTTSAPHRRGSGRSRAANATHLTSQAIASDIAEFKKRGGRIEVLGNTPLRPYASKTASRKTAATKAAKTPARTTGKGTAKKTGTAG